MSSTGLVLDARFKRHDTGPNHPERPARLDAIHDALRERGLIDADWPGWADQTGSEAGRLRADPSGDGASGKLECIPATRIDDELILRVHSREYLTRLEAACRAGGRYIDEIDSAIGPDSCEIARLAAGAVAEAARRIASGRLRRAFCAVRPPGHHCEAGRSMGFCLLNNVAIAARLIQHEFNIGRVLILDWDVHHGNGTQHIFDADPSVLFISLHGHPSYLYPGTGYETEIGVGPGRGFTLNIPFMPGADDAAYREAFERKVLPKIDDFKPEFFILSAGFDAHQADPLAESFVTDAGFDWMTRAVIESANRHAGGRILSVLEGGYDLGALGRCVASHASLLAGD